VFSFTNVQDENCDNGDGFIDIEISGGSPPYTYHWSNNAVTQDLTDLFQGNYTVTVTDASNCHIVQSFHVNNANSTNIQINALVTDAYCANIAGSIDLTVTGGMSPMIYNWSNGSTTPDISNLAPGTYTIVIADDAGCSNTASYLVEQGTNPNLEFAYISITNDYCNSGTGSIYFDGLGAAWFDYYVNGAMVWSPYVENLTSGTYLLEIYDPDGCVIDSLVTVGNDVSFNVTHSYENETCGMNDGSIDLTVTGASVTYHWNTGASTQDLSGLTAGTYTVTISDGNCTDIIPFTITDVYDFNYSSSTSPDFCGDSTGSIDLQITGGGTMSYLWSNGAITQDLNGIVGGTYSCTITNTSSGCVRIISVTVTTQSTGVAINSTVIPDTCDQGNGSILNTVYGGSGNYSYEWSHGPTTEDLFGLHAGSYALVVTDNNDGCELNCNFTVNSLLSFTASGTAANASCDTCSNGTIDVTVTSLNGIPNTYTYAWSHGAATQDVTGLLPGNYQVTITSSAGCDTVLSFTVGYTIGIGNVNTVEPSVEIYPNPASTIFIAEINIPGLQKAMFQLRDMRGQILSEESIENNGTYRFDISTLAPGTYQVIVRNGQYHFRKKLVIIR
jgi:hypothetical protein